MLNFLNNLRSKLALFFLLFNSYLFAQFNQWVWIHGSQNVGGAMITGTKGIPASANIPGASYEGSEWTDLNGYFWFLSGAGYFWKYDPSTNMWTWINNGPTNFGTQGVPSATNFPGAHSLGATTWTDLNNNLWLYAGVSGGWDANMWKYNIATGQWTWMKGPGSCSCYNPNYGTIKVAASTNEPGSRAEASASWVDASGNLWFMGGQVCNGNCSGGGSAGGKSDVWKYDIATNNWIWMNGATTPLQPPVYGPKGVASTANTPGGRMVYASAGGLNNKFLLFGGINNFNTNNYNDLWEYDPVNDTWAWLSGTNLVNQNGVYGTKCVPSNTVYPGSGFEVRTRWSDDCGNLWLFGAGTNYDATNALWRYSLVGNTWTWVNGTSLINQNGTYGTLNIPAATNIPGSRKGGNAWRNKDALYMFGGRAYGATGGSSASINDMWKYIPDKPTAVYSYTTLSNCIPSTVTFTNSSTPGCNEIKSYLWDFGDPASGANNMSTLANPTHVFSTVGNFSIKLLVINCTGSRDSVIHNFATTASVNTADTFNVCSGQSILIHGLMQSLPGVYTQTYTSTSGCDSISSVTLNTANPITTSSSVNICSGQSSVIHGISRNTSGVYTQTYIAATGGCDSISTVTLTVNSVSSQTINPVACTSYTVNSQVYSTSGIYSQTLTNAVGCDSMLTINLTVTPIINTNNNISICSGNVVLIHGVNQNTGGIYTQSFTTSSGCDSISTVNLTVIPSPTLTVSPLLDTIESGNSIIIAANGASAYSWSDGSIGSSIVVSPTQNTTYCVIGTNSVICSDTICSDVIVITATCDGVKIFIPTGFSPNGDGQNDELKLFATGIIETMHFAVYNRWGQIVFETTDITKPWDGYFNSQPMDVAVFTYTLRYSCKSDNTEEVVSGNISLVR